MAHININITLDNIPADADANKLADMIEGIVERYTNMDVQTTVYDNDGVGTSNPIMTHNTLKRIER